MGGRIDGAVADQHHAREAGSHVLVVAAFRSEEVVPENLLRRMEPRAALSLRPLGLAEIGDVARSMAGPLPEDVVATVARLSEGSPFMATAVVRGLVESGALVESTKGWRVEKDALADIQTSRRAALFLVRRLELLSPAALRLLSVGAVLGKNFDLVMAIDLSGLSAEQAVPALDEARRRRIVWVDEQRGRCLRDVQEVWSGRRPNLRRPYWRCRPTFGREDPGGTQ
ncbi:MAG: hypothetical protein ACRD1K_03790 [Acidimicrobiales bacterium]